ncbi:MAG: restriction endonuclease subunit S [Gammaproteobacteria bacterium]|nr:restriction endonuclease subunit S [Gammaproteobacteria bacterium]
MSKRWTYAKLGDIADVQSGGTPSVANSDFWGGDIPWYSSGELNEVLTVAPERRITEAGLAGSNAKLFPAGSLLVGMYDTAAMKMSILDRDAAFNQAIAGVKPNDALNIRFVFYALNSIKDELLGQRRGVRQKNLSLGKVREFPIPLCPLGEQHRIVTLLDEAFEGIATAKAHAEQNLRNSRTLFETLLSHALARGNSGWREVSLADATGGVCTGPFGSLLHKSDYVENGIPLINPAHITDVGFAPDFRKSVSALTAQRLSSYLLHQGDIVIGRRGEMGRCAVVSKAEEGWLCGTGSFIIRSSSQCDSRFLARLLRSEGCKKRLEKIAGGAVMPNLSNSDLGDFLISLPPLDVQREILREVDVMAQEIERLEGIYQRKLTALTELQQSLLHQAFTGKL